MRLGDLDKLADYLDALAGDTIAMTDVVAIVDAAPTVSCEECEHQSHDGPQCWNCGCGDNFKRRHDD